MTKWIVGLSILLIIFSGCASEDDKPRYTAEELAQIPQPIRGGLPQPTGGFVLAVGTETISSEEIIGPLLTRMTEFAQKTPWEQFAPQATPVVAKALRDQVADTLLYQQAKKQAGEEIDEQLNAAVEKEMRRFIVRFEGNYAQAEEFLRDYYGMDWEQFRKQQRRMILSGSYLQGQLQEEGPVTYNDMQRYYDSVKEKLYTKPPTITIRLIDIDISEVQTKDEMSRKQAAAEKAKEIMEKLNSGADFAELAKEYSDGYKKLTGGLWDPVNPEALAQPYDVLAIEAETMMIGEIAGPLEAEGHMFIMKLEDKRSDTQIPLEDVQKEIEQQIIQERKVKDLDKVMSKLMEEASIAGLENFTQYCVAELYQRANQK